MHFISQLLALSAVANLGLAVAVPANNEGICSLCPEAQLFQNLT